MGEGIVGSIVQVVVSVLATASVIGGAVLAGRWNARTKQLEATTPTYAEVTARLDKLEKDVLRFEEQRDRLLARERVVAERATAGAAAR